MDQLLSFGLYRSIHAILFFDLKWRFKMNYSPIKKAMLAIGHVVSEGEQWLATDVAAFRDFAHFTLGIAHDKCHAILQYPEHFVDHWARIHELAGSEPAAAPIETAPVLPVAAAAPIEAPVVTETPAETPAEIPVEVPVITETPVETPVETSVQAQAEPEQAPVTDPVQETEPAQAPAEPVDETTPEAPATMTFNVIGDNKE